MRSHLEDHFPHLVPGLTENWDDPAAFKAFMSSLIFDTRGGRTGWPAEAWEELSLLETLHKVAFPPQEAPANEREVHDDIKWVS
mgnify:CR=1 FL=1